MFYLNTKWEYVRASVRPCVRASMRVTMCACYLAIFIVQLFMFSTIIQAPGLRAHDTSILLYNEPVVKLLIPENITACNHNSVAFISSHGNSVLSISCSQRPCKPIIRGGAATHRVDRRSRRREN